MVPKDRIDAVFTRVVVDCISERTEEEASLLLQYRDFPPQTTKEKILHAVLSEQNDFEFFIQHLQEVLEETDIPEDIFWIHYHLGFSSNTRDSLMFHVEELWKHRHIAPQKFAYFLYIIHDHEALFIHQSWIFSLDDEIFSDGLGWILAICHRLYQSDFPLRHMREIYEGATQKNIELSDLTESIITMINIRRIQNDSTVGDLITELCTHHLDTIFLTEKNIHNLCIIFTDLFNKGEGLQEHLHQFRLLREAGKTEEYSVALELLLLCAEGVLFEKKEEISYQEEVFSLIENIEIDYTNIDILGDVVAILGNNKNALALAKKIACLEGLSKNIWVNIFAQAIAHRDIEFALQCKERIEENEEELLPNFLSIYQKQLFLFSMIENPEEIQYEKIIEMYKPFVFSADTDVLLDAEDEFEIIFEQEHSSGFWLHVIYAAIARKRGRKKQSEELLKKAEEYTHTEEERFWIAVEYCRLLRSEGIDLQMDYLEEATKYLHIHPVRWCHQLYNAADYFPVLIPNLQSLLQRNVSKLEDLVSQEPALWYEIIDLQIILSPKNTLHYVKRLFSEYEQYEQEAEKIYKKIAEHIEFLYYKEPHLFGLSMMWLIQNDILIHLDTKWLLGIMCLYTDFVLDMEQGEKELRILYKEVDSRDIGNVHWELYIAVYKAKLDYFYTDRAKFIECMRELITAFMDEEPTEDGLIFILNLIKESMIDLDLSYLLSFWYINWEENPEPQVLVNILGVFIQYGQFQESYEIIQKIEKRKHDLVCSFAQIYLYNKMILEEISGISVVNHDEYEQVYSFMKNSPSLDIRSLGSMFSLMNYQRQELWGVDIQDDVEFFLSHRDKLPLLRVFQIAYRIGVYSWKSYEHTKKSFWKDQALALLQISFESVQEEPIYQLQPLRYLMKIEGIKKYQDHIQLLKESDDVPDIQILYLLSAFEELSVENLVHCARTLERVQEYQSAAEYWYRAFQCSTNSVSSVWYLERAISQSTKLLRFVGHSPQKRNAVLDQTYVYVQSLVDHHLRQNEGYLALRALNCLRNMDSYDLKKKLELQEEGMASTTQRLIEQLVQKNFSPPVFISSHQMRNMKNVRIPMSEIKLLGISHTYFWDSCPDFVEQYLKPGELCIELFSLANEIVVFCITQGHVGWYKVSWKDRDTRILNRVLSYLEEPWKTLNQESNRSEFWDFLQKIQNRLFPKFAMNLIQRSQKFWIACSSKALNIPFSLFKTDEKYWIDSHMPRLLFSSSQLMTRAKEQPMIDNTVLLRGSDEFHDVLPLADAEVNSIGLLFQKHNISIAETSTANIDVLHYAGHADFDSELLEGTITCKGRKIPSSYFATLNLQDAVVFLSACQSSTSGKNNNSIVGFPRAIFAGGARSFIGTAWPTSDTAAQRVSNGFYDRLLNGNEPAMALQESIAELRISMPEIWHWANFRYFGH